jgi:hypothetical protein
VTSSKQISIPVLDLGGNDTAEIISPPSNDGTFIIVPNPNLPPVENSPNIISQVVEITFVSENGTPVVFDGEAKLCFQVNQSRSDSCLGYLDESVSPPKWKCEDECLDSHQGKVCGKTSHFTSFAILLQGGAGGGCDSGIGFILGSGWKDLVLILSFVVSLWCCLCLLVLCACCTPCGKRAFYGEEHNRVATIRRVSRNRKYTFNPNTANSAVQLLNDEE